MYVQPFFFAASPVYQSRAANTRNFDLHLPQLGFTQQNKQKNRLVMRKIVSLSKRFLSLYMYSLLNNLFRPAPSSAFLMFMFLIFNRNCRADVINRYRKEQNP